MDFDSLRETINKARDAMEKALVSEYPEGSRVYVILKHGQIMASAGIVVCHDGDGYVGVRLDNAKPHTRRPCRSVYFTDIEK